MSERSKWQEERGPRFGNQRRQQAELKVRRRRNDRAEDRREARKEVRESI